MVVFFFINKVFLYSSMQVAENYIHPFIEGSSFKMYVMFVHCITTGFFKLPVSESTVVLSM